MEQSKIGGSMWACLYRGTSGKLVLGMHLSNTKELAEARGKNTYPKAFVAAVYVNMEGVV
jgi:acetoacetate decarboxylase